MPAACSLIVKETPAEFFPVNYKIFKNAYFEEHLRTAVSDSSVSDLAA